MKVGVMGDSHDRVPVIAELIQRFAAAGAGLVMHAGDYCSPFSLAPFAEAKIPLLGVFGRNDGDPEGLREAAGANVGTELYESPHSFEISGQRIILVHDLNDVMARWPGCSASGPWPKHGPHHDWRISAPTDRSTSAIDSPPRRLSGRSIWRPTPPLPGNTTNARAALTAPARRAW